jgi:hypothetical protein
MIKFSMLNSCENLHKLGFYDHLEREIYKENNVVIKTHLLFPNKYQSLTTNDFISTLQSSNLAKQV